MTSLSLFRQFAEESGITLHEWKPEGEEKLIVLEPDMDAEWAKEPRKIEGGSDMAMSFTFDSNTGELLAYGVW